MPKPVYIICAQSCVEDHTTHLISLFNVVEKVVTNQGHTQVQLPPFAVFSSWMEVDGDPAGQQYEGQLVLRRPGVGLERTLGMDSFSFKQPFHRFKGELPSEDLTSSGWFWVEHRIRKVGDVDWLMKQDYPIIVEESSTTKGVVPEPGIKEPRPSLRRLNAP